MPTIPRLTKFGNENRLKSAKLFDVKDPQSYKPRMYKFRLLREYRTCTDNTGKKWHAL